MQQENLLPVFSDEGGAYCTSLTEPGVSRLALALSKAAPDAAIVVEYLASGRGLSGQRAALGLGILDLDAQIKRLREFGVPITGEWHQDRYHDHFLVYRYSPEGHTGDEPFDPYHGTHSHEDDGGPAW